MVLSLILNDYPPIILIHFVFIPLPIIIINFHYFQPILILTLNFQFTHFKVLLAVINPLVIIIIIQKDYLLIIDSFI